jgi:hypothetical protein
MDGYVYALAYGTIGGASKFFAGGSFSYAGSTAVKALAQWDGSNWSAIGTFGSGLDNVQVNALTYASNNLYVAWSYSLYTSGRLPNTIYKVSKWNGSSWTELGTFNSAVSALACSGTTVYAGGGFTTVGTTAANAIAKYDGSSWSAMGSGISGGTVTSLVCDTSGNLYVGGGFGSPGNNIAMWNGSAWSTLGSGTNSTVYALAFDSAGALYVGGSFTSPGNYIAVYK